MSYLFVFSAPCEYNYISSLGKRKESVTEFHIKRYLKNKVITKSRIKDMRLYTYKLIVFIYNLCYILDIEYLIVGGAK